MDVSLPQNDATPTNFRFGTAVDPNFLIGSKRYILLPRSLNRSAIRKPPLSHSTGLRFVLRNCHELDLEAIWQANEIRLVHRIGAARRHCEIQKETCNDI